MFLVLGVLVFTFFAVALVLVLVVWVIEFAAFGFADFGVSGVRA